MLPIPITPAAPQPVQFVLEEEKILPSPGMTLWLQERLRSVGSSYLLASKWGYPWNEIKRLARHFGIPLPDRKTWVGKYVLLEKEAIKKVDERRRPHQSRNRWIIEALEAYYRSQEYKDEGAQKKHTDN